MTTASSRVSRALIVMVGVFALLLALLGAPEAGATSGSTSKPKVDVYLTLLHNNDGESALLEVPIVGQNFGGVAPFGTLVENLRKEGNRDKGGLDRVALLVSAGDNYLPSAQFQASLDKGRPFYDAIAMEILDYDASAIGNHEFDFGPEVVVDWVRSFRKTVPFVSANLDFSGEPPLERLEKRGKIADSTIVRIDGEKFGIIGATTEELSQISSPRNVVAESVLVAVQQEVSDLRRKGVNKIILVSHLQSILNEIALASQLDHVDIIVAGGGQELLANPDDLLVTNDTVFGPYPMMATDLNGTPVPVVTTNGAYKYLGKLGVSFDRQGNIIEIDAAASGPVRVTTGTFPDAVTPHRQITRKVVEPVAAYVASLATIVVGTSEVPLNSARGTTVAGPPVAVNAPGERVSDTNLGGLVADALLWQGIQNAAGFGAPEPQIAIQNGGGIRQPDTLLLPGATPATPANLTRLDVNNQLPFANFVAVVPDVPLSVVKANLENGVSRMPAADGRFPHVAGMTFEWSSSAAAGSRVKKITIGGTLVYDEAAGGYVAPATAATTYDVATIDFLARGSDGYSYPGLPFVIVGATYEQAFLNYLSGPLGGTITQAAYPNVINTRAIMTP